VLERLWAGWRSAYVEDGGTAVPRTDRAPGVSLFEGIERSGLPDEATYILARGARCFVILNAYPYISGHLMVLPRRAVPHLEDLHTDEYTELWATVRTAVVAVKAAYRPDGVNVGINLGEAAGAGVPDHLHVHVLPRWSADTNFTTAIAEARILPEPLSTTWRKLRDAWPEAEQR
jgi:ATP adenylyltransferase